MDPTNGQVGMEDRELEELMVKSFIQIMMDTEKTAEGKAELAQAQENDRKRRETQLQQQLGQDILNSQTQNQPSHQSISLSQPPYLQQSSTSGSANNQPNYAAPPLSQQHPASQHYQSYQTPQTQSLTTNPSHPIGNTAYQLQQQQPNEQYFTQYQQQQQSQQPNQIQTNYPYYQQQPNQIQTNDPYYQQQPNQIQPNDTYYQQQPNQIQTNDPYYQLQLKQQQLQQEYEQKLIQLQQQQYQKSNQLQEQVPASHIPNTNESVVPDVHHPIYHHIDQPYNSGVPYDPVNNFSNHSVGNISNNNTDDYSHNSRNTPRYHGNVDVKDTREDKRHQNISHGDGLSLVPHSQQIYPFTPTQDSMTNSVSKLSNTDGSSIDIYAHSGDAYANPNYISSKAGPLGMSLTDRSGENAPKIIVLDQSDNEVEDGTSEPKGKSLSFKNDIFPINNTAVDRDMFRQEFVPQSKMKQRDTNSQPPQTDKIVNGIDRHEHVNENAGAIGQMKMIDPAAFNYPDITSNPNILLAQPSDLNGDEKSHCHEGNEGSDADGTPQPFTQRNLRRHDTQLLELSYQELLQQRQQLQNELFSRQQEDDQRLLTSSIGNNALTNSDSEIYNGQTQLPDDIDLERYTYIPSQLTSIKEDVTLPLDSPRDNVYSSIDTYRTIDPDPFSDDQNITDLENNILGNNSIQNVKNDLTFVKTDSNFHAKGNRLPHGRVFNPKNQKLSNQRYLNNFSSGKGGDPHNPAFKVVGPGYKVDVSNDKVILEKRATRANILSRAERLLDSRKTHHLTDKSDSSDGEMSRGKNDAGYEEEDDDDVRDLHGPRHRALKHVRPQYYDDTTSYNSSDDVLNTLRFHKQGPLTKAARRARLTSFNARLHKQRRIKAAMRLNSRNDTDLNNYLEKGTIEEDTEREKFDSDISEIKTKNNEYNPTQDSRGPPQKKEVNSNKKPVSKNAGIPRKPKLKSIPKSSQKPTAPPQQTEKSNTKNLNPTPKLEPISNGRAGTESDTEETELYGASRPRKLERKESYKAKAVVSKVPVSNESNHLPTMSDEEYDSSEGDVLGRYEDRYEEAKLRDMSNDQRFVEEPQEDANSIKKGRRVYFFSNGDVHYKPKQVLISSRTFQNFEKLLVDLSSMIQTSSGVRYIFSWPDGKLMSSITQFENGRYYICSSTKKLQIVDYGNSKEGTWKGGKIERQDNFLFQKSGKVQSPLRKPRILTIISNLYRDSREKMILNTNSTMNFEEILNDIVNLVNIPNPPVKALFTERKPHQQVSSYSQLMRDFADHDNFIACGEEMVPMEMSSKRPRNAHASSSEGSKRGQKKTPRYVSHGEDGGGSPTRSSAMTTYTDVTRQPRPDPRRRRVDSIRVDINGKNREFFPPTVFDDNDDGMKPDKKLKLEWVYGFRGRDVKQNLVVLPTSGELVYFVAAVVVLYDKKFSIQRHYLGHNEEVTCLTIHPNGRFLASGQLAGKSPESGAHVRIWDGTSLSTYAVVGLGVFQQGIACINFSERESPISSVLDDNRMVTGDLLMAIDDSDRHVLSIWEWQTEKLVSKTTLIPFIMKTTSDPVVSGCFYPFDDTIVITYGKEHIHFWRVFWEKGRKVMRDKLSGNFEDDVPKFVTSIAFSPNGDVITGDSNGAILIWTRDNSSVFSVNDSLSIYTKRAHKKSVASLCMLGDGTLLSGGGSEIKAWDSINDYSMIKERLLPEMYGHIRSIVPVMAGGPDGSIFVSTTKNKVLEGSLQFKFKSIILGHVEELWAIESHPLESTFITAGHDQSVAKWSAVSHAPVWRVDIEKPCTSISIDPKGRLVALGTTGGKVIILNSYNGIQLTTLLTGPTQVNALAFSPGGTMLAVGTYDGTINLFYTMTEGYKFFSAHTTNLKPNLQHQVFVMHIDWSEDENFLQVAMGDYDVIYWDINTMKRNRSVRMMRDVKWATHHCPIGYPVIGPWHSLDRGDVINVLCRSQYRDLMVCGDNKGRMKLFKWPCSVPKPAHRTTKVYSSNVTAAVFTSDDSYLVSSGGNDAALMQFAVLDPTTAR